MKSSTIHKKQFTLIVYFLFPEKVEFCATSFPRCEKIIFLHKKVQLYKSGRV